MRLTAVIDVYGGAVSRRCMSRDTVTNSVLHSCDSMQNHSYV